MRATEELHKLGQSLWLDNITRELLESGTLRRYRDAFSVTGLTSNPTIFDLAIRASNAYDESIRQKTAEGKSGEELFYELALADLTQAADLFREIHRRRRAPTAGFPWKCLRFWRGIRRPRSRRPRDFTEREGAPNLFIKIPGTPESIPAIEESIFQGVPVNVTLLFSREQYIAAAEAYMRGIERRIRAGRDANVHSVASLFISRWDKAVMQKVPDKLRNRLGIAIARRTYKAYRDLLHSDRWQILLEAGAVPQRVLWASTGTKDPEASDVLYIEALAAPDTINTIPEKTLLAFEDHGQVKGAMPVDGGDAEKVLAEFTSAGIDHAAIAVELQREGAESFDKSWNDLMDCLRSKTEELKKAS